MKKSTYVRPDAVTPSFTAPLVNGNTTLTFQLTVKNSLGLNDTDDVVIFVKDLGNSTCSVFGAVLNSV